MKIAAYVDTGVMEIREIPAPEPKDDEVLVKVSYCGICGSDIHQVQYGMQEPGNIRMGHEGCGIVTEVGKIQGTLTYMSREQAHGDSREINLLSDVYALGVIHYELLTGRLPYEVRRTLLPEALRVI